MNDAGDVERELIPIARRRSLGYPIESKRAFVEQMTRSPEPVRFRGIDYDSEFAAELIPGFFFPVTSERDLLRKATELLIARGFVPVAPGGDDGRARGG